MLRADSAAAAVGEAAKALKVIHQLTNHPINSDDSHSDALGVFATAVNACDKLISVPSLAIDRQALRLSQAIFRLGPLWLVWGQQGQEPLTGEAELASEALLVRSGQSAMREPEPDESLTSEQIIDLVSRLYSPDDTVRKASEETLGRAIVFQRSARDQCWS